MQIDGQTYSHHVATKWYRLNELYFSYYGAPLLRLVFLFKLMNRLRLIRLNCKTVALRLHEFDRLSNNKLRDLVLSLRRPT